MNDPLTNMHPILETAKQSGNIVVGGTCDKSVGWFVHPTVVQVEDPKMS